MSVVFEEENFSFNNQNSQSVKDQKRLSERTSPLNQAIMLFFACLCVLGAYFVPSYINPPKEGKVIYLEDITESRMRLIPEKDREAFISKFPSRGQSGQ